MEVKTPQGELYILKVPEKYLLMNKAHTLDINIKNLTQNSDKPTDFYLKYRANGCKLVNVPNNLDNNVRFSMSPGQDFTFQIQIMPTIEGPLQLEIQFIGIQKEFKEKTVEYEVEIEKEVSGGGFEKVIQKQSRIEQEVLENEVQADSKMAYMESINAGDSQNLETIITQGDIATHLEDINLNVVIFHFPKVGILKNPNFLREINKHMDMSLGKSFLYVNFPLHDFSDKEQGIIRDAVNKFLPKLATDKPIFVFNLEFLPKLGVPTIILGRDDSINQVTEIYSVLHSQLQDKFAIKLDSNVIAGGLILEILKGFCTPFGASVINVALSGEFQESIDNFVNFMNVFN